MDPREYLKQKRPQRAGDMPMPKREVTPQEREMMMMQQAGQRVDPNFNMPNPFQNPAFQNNVPDIPMQDSGAAMLNALLSDSVVPDKIKEEFWFIFHRDNVLTFLDVDRKRSKMLNFDIIKIDTLNNTPWYNYTFEKEQEWNAARQIFETKLDRALGNKGGKNERLTIPMTIQENINRNVGGEMEGQAKEGFLRRMLSRK